LDINSVTISPDGKLLAIPDCYQEDNSSFKLYDTFTGMLVKTFSTPSSQPWIGSLTFSSDSKMIFATYGDSSSRLWDIASGQILRLFNGTDPENHASAYSPDGKLVIRGLNVWWDYTSDVLFDFLGGDSKGSYPSIFSGDGNLLAIADFQGKVTIYQVSPKQYFNHFLSGHSDQITSMAFSPDNKFLLTGSADKTTRLWDITSGQLLRVFSGHTSAVTSVNFTSDGKRIVTTSLDKTVRTWITDYNDLLAYACSRVGSDLSPEERILYGIADQDPTCPQFGEQSQPLMPTTTPMPTPTPWPQWTPIPTATLEVQP
jgi:WD40 repeat protein